MHSTPPFTASCTARSFEIISGKTVDAFVGYSVSDADGLKTLSYATDVTDIDGHLSAPSFVLFMNKKRWQGLPQADRDAIQRLGGEAFAQSMAVYDDLEAKARAAAVGLCSIMNAADTVAPGATART